MSKNEYNCDCNIIHKEVVNNVIKNMPSEETILNISDFFKILGDNTRCKILSILDGNELCVCDIANILNMTKSSISHQLKLLRLTNIVKCNKVGKEVYYSLDDEHVTLVFEVALSHINHKKESK